MCKSTNTLMRKSYFMSMVQVYMCAYVYNHVCVYMCVCVDLHTYMYMWVREHVMLEQISAPYSTARNSICTFTLEYVKKCKFHPLQNTFKL